MWGNRLRTGLIIVLVILVGLLLTLDRVGAWAAERTVAEKVSQEMTELKISAGEPDVTVGGFPFLTQVVDGRYEEIRILLRDVSVNGIVVPELDVYARGVNAQMSTLLSGGGEIVADHVSGTATIGYASVRALINRPGLEVSEQNGKLRLRLPLTVAGQKVTAVAVADAGVANGLVRISVVDIRAEGIQLVPQAQRLLDQYKSVLSVQLRLPPLPFGLRVEGAQVRPEGLAVVASAQGVPINGGAGQTD